MARPCSVCAHPKQALIDAELVAATPVAEMVSKWKIGESSIRRHVKTHLSASILRETRASESLGSVDLVERLIEALDDVAAVRTTALMSGQAAIVLRAATATESLVRTLMDRLGVEETEILLLLREGERLADAVARASRKHGIIGTVIAGELDELGDRDFGDALRAVVAKSEAARVA